MKLGSCVGVSLLPVLGSGGGTKWSTLEARSLPTPCFMVGNTRSILGSFPLNLCDEPHVLLLYQLVQLLTRNNFGALTRVPLGVKSAVNRPSVCQKLI